MLTLIENGSIVNEGRVFKGCVTVTDEKITGIYEDSSDGFFHQLERLEDAADKVVDAEGMFVAPGVIDEHVHFREPGATQKGSIESESRAAALGGVTSFMDMPNNNPPAVTNEAVEAKFAIAERTSAINYSFYLGATNSNLAEIENLDPRHIPAVKIFMGASTGDMLVDDPDALDAIFERCPILIATHCEDPRMIGANLEEAKRLYGSLIPFRMHESIRSREACISSTRKALDLALKHNSSLHILHISTAEEVSMLAAAREKNPGISGEACVNYLFFDDSAYDRFGPLIKCNPSIKTNSDMLALRAALNEGTVRCIGTDHAPHLFSEKNQDYLHAPSGVPSVQYSLQMMVELCRQGAFRLQDVVGWMSHEPARRYNIKDRGFIRKGYKADIVIFNADKPSTVIPASRAGWSLIDKFGSTVVHTMVNGILVVENGKLTLARNSQPLVFDR
jgi:dihydroorotase